MGNRDFLNGIDEDFQRLLSRSGNGNENGNGRLAAGAASQGSTTAQILHQLSDLTHEQRETVLSFIKSLKEKGAE